MAVALMAASMAASVAAFLEAALGAVSKVVSGAGLKAMPVDSEIQEAPPILAPRSQRLRD